MFYGQDIKLPEPTDTTDESARAFHAQCQQAVDNALHRLGAQQLQMVALQKIIDEKEATDRANALVKQFNTQLEEQYNAYKEATQKTICTLKEDLDDTKNVAASAVEETARQKALIAELTEQKRQLEARLQDLGEDVVSAEAEPSGKNVRKSKKQLAQELEEATGQLQLAAQELQKAKALPQGMAESVVEDVIKKLANIDGVSDQDSIIQRKIVEHIIKNVFKQYIGAQESNRLFVKLSDIEDERENNKAIRKETERQNRLEEARAGAMKQEFNTSTLANMLPGSKYYDAHSETTPLTADTPTPTLTGKQYE